MDHHRPVRARSRGVVYKVSAPRGPNIGSGAMDVTKPYEFMGFGAMDVTKPYEFIGFGALIDP